jgi:hypothetical protein
LYTVAYTLLGSLLVTLEISKILLFTLIDKTPTVTGVSSQVI